MKKVLFFSYYWPPSGRASLHLPLKIIQHLPSFGWQPTVVTIDEDTFSQKDESLLKEIPENLKVIKTKVFEPFNLYRSFLGKEKNAALISSETISKENNGLRHRLAIWIRMNLFVPDARIGWYPYAVRNIKEILQQEKFDAIISIGPPHTTHLIAKKASVLSGLPHIPVFIDPWVDIVYYSGFKRSWLTLAIDNHFEKSVLKNSAATVFVTASMLEDYVKKYQWLKEKSHVLYWGYNEEDFASVEVAEKKGDEKVLIHAGNIFDYQNPVNLWKRINTEIAKGNKIRLKFVGTVSPLIKKTIIENGLDSVTDYPGFLPYPEMIKEVMNADYTLVCATEKRHVPGKLFEYLRSCKPILAYGNDNDEVARIIRNANAGMLVNYEDDGEIFFTNAGSFKTDLNYVKRFDRKNITENLCNIVNSL
jgi:glycosyltransferase involved in cell wall biosynthesis